MVRTIKRLWAHFLNDTLFRNSVYLMLTTGIMGLLGFFFWLISTHVFSPDEIGIGTALISAMTLISTMGLLGFNSTFVRVLPDSKNRNNEINAGSLLVIVASAIIAIGYVLLIPEIAPNLSLVRESFWYSAGFVVMVALASINSLTDSIFIAYRAAQYTLITDAIVTSGSKLLLPLVFFVLGAYGVFASAGLAASFGMVASVIYLVVKFDYRPQFKIDGATVRDVFHYSFTNYVANLLNMIPVLILPIIVLDHLGAAAAGYYYLSFMIINLLYTVSVSVAQSLFAEGSYGGGALRPLLKRSTKIMAAIMIPACLVLAVLGPFVLDFFGKAYSAGGSSVIVLLALSAPIIAAYNITTVLLKIRKQVYSLIFVNIMYATLILGLTFAWIHNGLIWVAVAWAIGNLAATIVAALALFYDHRKYVLNSTNQYLP